MNGREFTKALERREDELLAPYALKSARRRAELGAAFREHPEASPLEYRTEYHRDRDRIVWSRAFKRLQHKTQVFPHDAEDHYRRRLTHTLEVAQIATTLARSLRVNETAAEAIALGHDIGHTPFGHGGELELNNSLSRLYKSKTNRFLKTGVPLYGFDHCSQSVEVVSRCEAEYNAYSGLNLSFDVRDGILKHIYDRPQKKRKRSFIASRQSS
jgi:dGTPase